MISDSATKVQFVDAWYVIQKFCSGSHRQAIAGSVMINETPPDEFYNLAVVLAFSLLDQVLTAFSDQGLFVPPSRGALLGVRMVASRSAVSWNDFAQVEAAKGERNKLAHEGLLIPKAKCLEIVRLIGVELKSWEILA